MLIFGRVVKIQGTIVLREANKNKLSIDKLNQKGVDKKYIDKISYLPNLYKSTFIIYINKIIQFNNIYISSI